MRFQVGKVVVRRAYREHRFLRGELRELGVEVLALFRGKETVEVGLAFAGDVGHGALEGAGHAAEAAAEAAAYHVCHVGGMDREEGDGAVVIRGRCSLLLERCCVEEWMLGAAGRCSDGR